ncbi:MAG: MraY family glycosyltransferase [Spirochaetales bacterium]
MTSPWIVVGAAAAALVLNSLLTPLILSVSRRRNWVDEPNHRTVHKDPVPRLGGVGMFGSIGVVLLGLYVADLLWPGLVTAGTWTWSALLLLLGLGSTHVLGVLDDFVELRAIYKLLLQLLGALLAIGAGLSFDHLAVPFTDWVLNLGPFAPFVTLLWVVGITNAVNLIDGMDGLAGGFSLISLASIGAYYALSGQFLPSVVAFVAAGAVMGFLFFNFPPAKLFMGDSGSLTLGYLLAVLPLWGGTQSLMGQYWLLPIVLVLVPMSDTLAAILRRLRENRPIWSPDKEHMHHKMLNMGVKTKQVLAIVYAATLVTAAPVVLAGVFHSPPLDLWMSLAAGLVILVLFSILHYAHRTFVRKKA